MTKLSWDISRNFQLGVDQGVLYLPDYTAVPWNGLQTVEEAPSGVETSVFYMDGRPHHRWRSPGSYAAKLTAFTYPEEFYEYAYGFRMGRRKEFNFSYRTAVHRNEVENDPDYQIHLVYNASAAPSAEKYETLGGSVDPISFSWDISTRPEIVKGYQPSAHIYVDSGLTHPLLFSMIEELVYGSETDDPALPLLADVYELFKKYTGGYGHGPYGHFPYGTGLPDRPVRRQ